MSLPKSVMMIVPFGGRSNASRRTSCPAWLSCLWIALTLFLCCGHVAWGEKGNSLSENAVWSPEAGPYVIERDLLIPADVTLTINPGTRILFDEGTSLIIEGKILASGTLEEPIQFTSLSLEPAPGDWGSLRFVTADTTLSYDEEGNFIKGSRLENCVIEYGGQPDRRTPKEFLGGAVHCRKSSPYLKNLIIRYNKSQQGGGIYCHEFASPYISNCLFKENEAIESGGGINCFFYSNAWVKDNIFQANRAGEHGGGIYFSFSSPQIVSNIIENNSAGVYGGGLYCSNTVTQAISRVRNNVLLSNRSKYQANNIYLTAKIETIFQENCFLAGQGYDVYIEALEKDLDLRGNYFGPPSKSDLEARTYDGYDDPKQLAVIFDPVLESPPPELPNAPQNISYFNLLGDAAYSSDWPLPLCDGAPVYLEVRAQDRNPYHADWIPVRLRSSVSDSKGLVGLAWETGPSTGVFRFQGQVASATIPAEGKVKALPGETVFFSVEGIEGFEVSRPVDRPMSYITALRLPEEADTFHVVNHQPVLSWTFRDIFGRKQESYQMQLSQGEPFAPPPLWDSGELMGSKPYTSLQNVALDDGETYGLRLRIYNGSDWSDWTSTTMRMNSLPTVPEPSWPENGKIVAEIRPQITLKASTDAQGDAILYEIQLYQDPEFQRVLGIEKELRSANDLVRWAAPADLTDDAEYYWRARSRDAYEIGPWATTGQFWVNLVEEPPLPFGLLDPEPGTETYQLEPVFSWEETLDPDPLSEVHYRLSYSRNPDLAEASTKTIETDMTFVKAPQPLKNEETYYWKVTAIDNTGRTTRSDQIGSFFVNTTPSAPQLIASYAGQEIAPLDKITWMASRDPDPEDRIQYRLQIAERDFGKPLAEDLLDDAGLTLESLKQYDLLVDNSEYRFRIRAEDNHAIASAWVESDGLFFFNKVNDPPAMAAAPLSPDGGVVTDPNPILSWGAARDADRSDPPERLSYVIQFDQDGDFREGIRQVQVMAGVTRVAVPGLADNQEWFYRIAARDDDGAVSSWSPLKRFVLNTKNDPPLPFALNNPNDGLETYKLKDIEFTWDEARDPDPGDSIGYWFCIALASDSTQIIGKEKLNKNSIMSSSKLKNETDYLWWVEAEDMAGLRTTSNEKFSFRVNTTPSVPEPVQLAEGLVTGGETFRWAPSHDPDPNDLLSYDLRIVAQDNLDNSLIVTKEISAVKAADGVSAASLQELKSLTDNEPYAFQVRARDQNGAVSARSKPAAFLLDLINEPPGAPTLLEPQEELTRQTEVTVRWSAAVDPDPSDRPETMAYRLQVAPGQNFDGAEISERAMLSGAHSLVDLQLPDNQLWSLRVRAEDARGGVSEWSAPVNLVVNTVEDPPSSPEVVVPEAGSVLPSTQPLTLSWTASEDPDYGAKITYEVRYWPQGEPENVRTTDAGSETSYTFDGLPGDQDYVCQVSAQDETGLETTGDRVAFRIEVPNSPPASFVLLTPDNGQVELPPLVQFTWESALDPDSGDEVSYTLFLAEDPFFSQAVQTYPDLEAPEFFLTEPLQEGITYYWKVVATDRKGLQTWGNNNSQKAFKFTVRMPSEIQNERERLR